MALRRVTPGIVVLACVTVSGLLAGCPQTTPGPVQPAPVGLQPAEPIVSGGFVFDVDPLRASAFERVGATTGVRVLVDMPEVRHDPATGRTEVTVLVSNAGEGLARLKGALSADRPLVSGALYAAELAPGEVRSFELAFDNPAAASFAIDLRFDGQADPSLEPWSGNLLALTGVSATASSSYQSPSRAIDGDYSTQWANGGYQEREAWLTLDTGASRSLSELKVKMRPQSGGAYYRLEVSADGVTFQPATGNLKNTTWNLETKTLPAGTQGRYLRIHFFNDPAAPETRFSVFEALIEGGGGTASPSPSLTPTPTPSPSSSTTPTGKLLDTFESYALGADPSDFIDPNNEGYSYSWMPRVTWRVTSYNGSKQYMHDGLSNKANLSFRRYRGNALGTTNGALPNRYFSEVDVTPIKSYTYAPTGDQGTQFYYLDPTNYVELLIKPNLFEVWVANNAQPFSSSGWQRVYYTNVSTTGGQTRRLATEIDANSHTMKVYLDGVLKTTLTHSKLSTQPHFFALRGTGNQVVHDNLKIEPR